MKCVVMLVDQYSHRHAKPPGFNYWPYKFLSWCKRENMFGLVFFVVVVFLLPHTIPNVTYFLFLSVQYWEKVCCIYHLTNISLIVIIHCFEGIPVETVINFTFFFELTTCFANVHRIWSQPVVFNLKVDIFQQDKFQKHFVLEQNNKGFIQ